MTQAKENTDTTVYDWFLGCCEVQFVRVKDGIRDEMKLNVFMPRVGNKVDGLTIANLQGEAQGKFWKTLQSDPSKGVFQVHDVYIANIVPLGRMTQEEFGRRLEKAKAERAREQLAVLAEAGRQLG